jgi:hypothetical protein
MIVKHQFVLEHLLETHPNNTGLLRAYNNSLRLEEKFGEKTMVRFNRAIEKNNQTILKAIRLEQKEHNRIGWPDATTTVTAIRTDDRQKGPDKDKGKGSGNGNPATAVTTQAPSTNQQQQGQGNQQAGNNDDKGNSNSGDKGKGNSKNK